MFTLLEANREDTLRLKSTDEILKTLLKMKSQLLASLSILTLLDSEVTILKEFFYFQTERKRKFFIRFKNCVRRAVSLT